jgi:hypothetical protein
MIKPTKLHEVAATLKLSVKAEFVPFSRSRNQAEPQKTLNWKVTLSQNARDIMVTDYSAGIAHCPAYKKPPKHSTGATDKYVQRLRITAECETGFASKLDEHNRNHAKGAAILPDECDVIYSLVLDSDVLDYSNFADWADNLSYDSDSIMAKVIYDNCLSTALTLLNSLGHAALQTLREACQDY